jgi:acyl-CoA thioesterase I
LTGRHATGDAAAAKAAPVARERSLRIVFFGDSICVGQGVSIYQGWVTRVAKMLDETWAGNGVEIIVVNASINGNTTRQALERMPYDVQSHGTDVLIVQFGLNDCNHWQTDGGVPRVSRDAFAANLLEIVERGERFGASAVLLNNNHPTNRDQALMAHADKTYEQSNREYNEIVREVATRLGGRVSFNDVERRFEQARQEGNELADLLLADGLHLSRAGHELYFDFLAPRIDAVVSKVALDKLGVHADSG